MASCCPHTDIPLSPLSPDSRPREEDQPLQNNAYLLIDRKQMWRLNFIIGIQKKWLYYKTSGSCRKIFLLHTFFSASASLINFPAFPVLARGGGNFVSHWTFRIIGLWWVSKGFSVGTPLISAAAARGQSKRRGAGRGGGGMQYKGPERGNNENTQVENPRQKMMDGILAASRKGKNNYSKW